TARRRPCPRDRAHGMDLRPAGDQECASEHRAPGRHRKTLSARLLWAIHLIVAGWATNGSPGCRVVAELGPRAANPGRRADGTTAYRQSPIRQSARKDRGTACRGRLETEPAAA